MEKLKLKNYIEEEIPLMQGCKGYKRTLAFRNAMLHYPVASQIIRLLERIQFY